MSQQVSAITRLRSAMTIRDQETQMYAWLVDVGRGNTTAIHDRNEAIYCRVAAFFLDGKRDDMAERLRSVSKAWFAAHPEVTEPTMAQAHEQGILKCPARFKTRLERAVLEGRLDG